MKKLVRKFLPLELLMGLLLASCSFSSANTYSYVEGTTLEKRGVSSLTYHDFFYQSKGSRTSAMPSTGNVKTLVLPIAFSDYSFDAETLKDLNAAFNGTSEETGIFESVSSYYSKSSFGQLSLTATIAPVYTFDQTAVSFMSASSNPKRSVVALRNALAAFSTLEEVAGDLTSYDLDKDGFLDGVYVIYASPDYISAGADAYSSLSASQKEEFWAYTYWDYEAGANLDSPNGKAFTWASYDFMYAGIDKGKGADAHTYIHETGHLLGLDDYYNYDAQKSDSEMTNYAYPDYRFYSPTGGLDMMDMNIGDHDAWSKFALGWNKPYVVDNSMSFPLTVELEDSLSDGSFVLIPDYASAYNGMAFGEYLMIELFNPAGLNAADGASQYAGKYPKLFFMPGIKITHIDGRFAKKNNVDPSGRTYLDSSSSSDILSLLSSSTRLDFIGLGSSNTPSYSLSPSYRLIHLLEANGTNTFKNSQRKSSSSSQYFANNGSLFVGDSDRGNFSMSKFSDFFDTKVNEKPTFNNGHEFGYSIRVNGIKKRDGGYKASITISLDK